MDFAAEGSETTQDERSQRCVIGLKGGRTARCAQVERTKKLLESRI
jgi:hypothetical protein